MSGGYDDGISEGFYDPLEIIILRNPHIVLIDHSSTEERIMKLMDLMDKMDKVVPMPFYVDYFDRMTHTPIFEDKQAIKQQQRQWRKLTKKLNK